MEEKYPHPKMNLKQKIENFWYYHRWMFLAVSVIAVFLLISLFQLVFKIDPDVSVLYVGSTRLSQKECEKLVQSVESLIDDSNKDGNVSAEMTTYHLLSDFELLDDRFRVEAMEKYQNYSDEILGGDCCFLLLDEYFYLELADGGALVNLYDVFPDLPKEAVDYFGLRLGDSPFYALEGFSALPEDTVICLKYCSVLTPGSDDYRLDVDLENMRLFRMMYEAATSK